MLLTVCIEAGRSTLTHTSWNRLTPVSRKWMSGQAAALATLQDRRPFANLTATHPLRESNPLRDRRPPSPLDFYLSWMSPNLSHDCLHSSIYTLPIFALHHSHGGCAILAFFQGWAAMLPAQVLAFLHRSLCMPSSYPPFAYAKNGHPQLWWLPQFESRATCPAHLRFPDPNHVALRSDLAHVNHQDSTSYFDCASVVRHAE